MQFVCRFQCNCTSAPNVEKLAIKGLYKVIQPCLARLVSRYAWHHGTRRKHSRAIRTDYWSGLQCEENPCWLSTFQPPLYYYSAACPLFTRKLPCQRQLSSSEHSWELMQKIPNPSLKRLQASYINIRQFLLCLTQLQTLIIMTSLPQELGTVTAPEYTSSLPETETPYQATCPWELSIFRPLNYHYGLVFSSGFCGEARYTSR